MKGLVVLPAALCSAEPPLPGLLPFLPKEKLLGGEGGGEEVPVGVQMLLCAWLAEEFAVPGNSLVSKTVAFMAGAICYNYCVRLLIFDAEQWLRRGAVGRCSAYSRSALSACFLQTTQSRLAWLPMLAAGGLTPWPVPAPRICKLLALADWGFAGESTRVGDNGAGWGT
jgi:hypothetical protein